MVEIFINKVLFKSVFINTCYKYYSIIDKKPYYRITALICKNPAKTGYGIH